MSNTEIKQKIHDSIKSFADGSLTDNALNIFSTLGYITTRQNPFTSKTFKYFKDTYIENTSRFNEDKALVSEWKYIDLLFQLSEEEVSSQTNLFDTKRVDHTVIETYLFFIIELANNNYSRTTLSNITREMNKVFPMPVMVLFKYGGALTFSIINRRLHKRDEQKDVLEKVSLIKDISINNPHRAHVEILFDLSFEELLSEYQFTNFVELHNAWQKTLDTKELNKRFYHELSNWYFWAMDHVSFPDDFEKNKEVRNATSLIRLITRIIFIWFIKEKDLVPEFLFDRRNISGFLKEFIKNNKSNSYYKAILQNLFFGTLNQKMDERGFAKDGSFNENKSNYFVKNLFRYSDLFAIPEKEALSLFKDVPFLNGGLFDCLDKENEEGKGLCADGFSRNPKKQANVPDFLFFSDESDYDLNEIYGTRNKRYKVKGLIDILNSYKFTVTENTPIEEEVALDPELLGKVFENLLASYNPETQTTARKQTGSFYTPREIVNYMVDEGVISYFKQKLEDAGINEKESELRELLSYSGNPNPFNENETEILIQAIDTCKILDPACGSGAFPMGILHKLVHCLHKLDPKNERWKKKQIDKVNTVDDSVLREQLIADIESAFENNELDYGRKLYLIENCIYGVDIQPVAVQIAKLRFFISLIIDQKKLLNKENFGIRALPNLETKFVAANTLIGLNKPEGVLINLEADKIEKEIISIRHKYFNAKTRKEKRKYQNHDKELRQKLKEILINNGWESETALKVSLFDPYDQNVSSPFFDPEWMFGITNGFDIIIGNPPYIEAKKLKYISQDMKNIYSTYSGTADLYVYFYENGIRNLKGKGTLIFITSNKFIKTSYGEKLRKYFTQYRINEIIDFTDIHVFEALVASCIFSISKKQAQGNHITIAFANDTLLNFADLSHFISQNSFYLEQDNLNEKIWQLENQTKLLLKNKIEEGSISILQTGSINVYRGVTTGYNPAFIIDDTKRKELLKEDKKNDEIIKPMLQGRNIRKWIYHKTSDYIIFTRRGIEINNYPSIKQHLKSFKQQLTPGIGRKPGNYSWYEIQDNTAYYPEFEKEKIIWGLTSDKWTFAYDNQGNYLPSNGYILTSNNIPIKYLLALLNSRLMEFYFGFIGIMTAGGAFTLKYETVIEFPIKIVEENIQNIFITLVDYILAIKDCNTEINYFERLIDSLVYELYFPNELKAANAEIFKHLIDGNILQEMPKSWNQQKRIELIDKVYNILSNHKHPVSIALFKLDTIEEIRIIEGKQ